MKSCLRTKNKSGLALAICLGLLAAPLCYSAGKEPSDAAKKAAERLKGQFDDIKQFDAAAKEAADAGVAPQTIAEAKLLFCSVNHITAPLPDLIGRLQAILPNWKESDSLFFQ